MRRRGPGKTRFPAPKGGEGELTCPIDFAARTPTGSWPGERIASVIGKKKSAIAGCRGKPGTAALKALRLTLYVGPGGSATSAGFSADEPQDKSSASALPIGCWRCTTTTRWGRWSRSSFSFADLFANGK